MFNTSTSYVIRNVIAFCRALVFIYHLYGQYCSTYSKIACDLAIRLRSWLDFLRTLFSGTPRRGCGVPVWLISTPCWRHQMETFSALLAICAGNSPVPGEFPAQRPVTRSFDVFFDLRLNKRLSKQSCGWWFQTLSCTLWRHRNVNDTCSNHCWCFETHLLTIKCHCGLMDGYLNWYFYSNNYHSL